MPHTPQSSGYFSPGFAAKQKRHAEEAVTDSPLLTPSGGLCAEQHWVTGSPRLPMHRTVYPGEQRPDVRPEELREALEKELRPGIERKESMKDHVEVKDFAYAKAAIDAVSKSTSSNDQVKPVRESDRVAHLEDASIDAAIGATSTPQLAGNLSPLRIDPGGEVAPTPPKERRGHRRSPAKDLRMKHGVMIEVGSCSAAPPTVT